MSEAQQASASLDESTASQVADIPASAEAVAPSDVVHTASDEAEVKMETENDGEPSARPSPPQPGSGRFGGKGAGSLAALKALSENKEPTTDVSIEKVIPTAMEVEDDAGASSSSLTGGGGKRLRLDVGGKKLDVSGTMSESNAGASSSNADKLQQHDTAGDVDDSDIVPDEVTREILEAIVDYNPVIPAPVSRYFVQKGGATVENDNVLKIFSLAAHSLCHEIVHEAKNHHLLRKQAEAISSKKAMKSVRKKAKTTTMTIEDLVAGCKEKGILVRKPMYFAS